MRSELRKPAFTLVELLVVIGIIAALIGILLPVLGGVASRGRDIQCQSNVKQIVQFCLIYAAENKGQFPYGVYDAEQAGWPAPIPGNHKLITLWSLISKMSNKTYTGEDAFVGAPGHVDPSKNTAPFLRCPEAMQVMSHVCSYAANWVAFVDPSDDRRTGGGSDVWCPLVDKPTKTSQCLPFTVLVWDTNVQPGMADDVGYILGADIDQQRFWAGARTPQWRYYLVDDPNGAFAGYGNNENVKMLVGNIAWKNIDPPGNGQYGFAASGFPWQGNLRYRHGKNTTCNVGFADGHVGQFVGKFKSDGGVLKYEAPRKSFMVRMPSGIGLGTNPSYPPG